MSKIDVWVLSSQKKPNASSTEYDILEFYNGLRYILIHILIVLIFFKTSSDWFTLKYTLVTCTTWIYNILIGFNPNLY